MSNFNVTKRNEVAVLSFDTAESKLNILSHQILAEIDDFIDQLEKDEATKAIVFISGKKDNFIAGANIEDFLTFKSLNEAVIYSQKAQAFMNKLEGSAKPIVCAINGVCLGGGLETALACHYRIATDNPKTRLGLPEVTLGILPAAGGTQRLPRLVGLAKSLPLLLTGKRLNANEAKNLGLVDYVCGTEGLLETAIDAAERLVSGNLKPKRLKQNPSLLTNTKDWVILRKAKSDVEKKTHGHYPAPVAIIDAVERGIKDGMKAGLSIEAQKFGELSQTSQAQNLIRLFFLQTARKKNTQFKTDRRVSHVGVLGAGFMGAGIALVSLKSKYDVTLVDIDANALGKAERSISKEIGDVIPRLTSSTNIERLKNCDLVIEAVFEDIAVKRDILVKIEPHLPEHCVFASNTSAIPIHEIAQNSARKDRIVGMHYFSPVHKMPLLEVIRTKESSNDAVGTAVDVGLRQGKTVIVVRDSPGFYTSRILTPYMDEAIAIALEGIDPREIDSYMEEFGFPVGPITLLDEVGIDVAHHATKELMPHFGSRFVTVDPAVMDLMIESGILGRKGKSGFYLYDEPMPMKLIKDVIGSHRSLNPKMKEILDTHYKAPVLRSITAQDIQLRMVLRMVNEAALCLQEQVIASEEDGDIGAVMGLGFPAFLGGPFQYIKKEGAARIVANLRRFADHFGPHFEPAPLLVDMGKK